jgi:hypothetical protein
VTENNLAAATDEPMSFPGETFSNWWTRHGLDASSLDFESAKAGWEAATIAGVKQPTLSDCSETLRLAVLANSTLAVGMVHGLYSLVKEPDPGPWGGFLKARLRAIKDMRDKGHSLEFIEATLNLQSPGHVERLLDANPDDPT